MEYFVVIASFLEGVFSPSALQDFSLKFLSVLFEGLPFIFIGTLISGLIDVYLPSSLMDRLLPKNRFLSIMTCGLLGLIIPVCECTVVPVIRRLVAKGLPVGSAFAYMLAAPIVNPITLMSTFTAFSGSWEIALSRMALGYLVAVFVGFLVLFIPIEKILKKAVLSRLNFSGKGHSQLPTPSECSHKGHDHGCGNPKVEQQEHQCGGHAEGHSHGEDHACSAHRHSEEPHRCGDHTAEQQEHKCSSHTESHSHGDGHECPSAGHHHHGQSEQNGRDDRIVSAMRVAMRDFIDVAVYFVIGVSLVTLLKESISAEESWVADLAASGEAQASAFMMALAFVLSLCSTSDAFVVATSFGEKFGRVSKMAFMVFGPMMDVKLLFLYQTLMRWRAVLLMALLLFILVGAACMLWGEVYGYWMVKSAEMTR